MEKFVPVQFQDLDERYRIDIYSGLILNTESQALLEPKMNEKYNELYTELDSPKRGLILCQLSSLLMNAIYGDIQARSLEKLTRFPVSGDSVIPVIEEYRLGPDRSRLYVNSVCYERWRDSHLYASSRGAIFDISRNFWVHLQYPEDDHVKFVYTDQKKGRMKIRADLVIYEANQGELKPNYEVMHLNGKKYDIRLFNLKAASHRKVMQARDPNSGILPDGLVCEIGRDLLNQIPTKEISRNRGVGVGLIQKIKNGSSYDDVLKDNKIYLDGAVYRDRKFSPDEVRSIREEYWNRTKSTLKLGRKYHCSPNVIGNMVFRRTYADVD